MRLPLGEDRESGSNECRGVFCEAAFLKAFLEWFLGGKHEQGLAVIKCTGNSLAMAGLARRRDLRRAVELAGCGCDESLRPHFN